MAVGGAASFFASQGKTFFKGLEGIRDEGSGMRNQGYVSILNVETESFRETLERSFESSTEENASTIIVEENNEAKIQPVNAPCSHGETPIIKNGKIESCGRKEIEPQKLPKPKAAKGKPALLPGPKVKILTESSMEASAAPKLPETASLQPTILKQVQDNLPPSCESQGKFTYTGPDRPGLLYGMCIDCETQKFIWSNGSCISS